MLQLYPTPSPQNASPEAIDKACEGIYRACKGMGTDEEALIEILGRASPVDRAALSKRYPELHKKELIKLIDSETSGAFGDLCELLCVSLPEAEARMLRKATKGAGTTEKHLYPVLCGRMPEELNVLKKTYFELFDEDLGSRLSSELSGDLKQFIIACCQELTEEYDPAVHTAEKAEADAEAFYNAGQGKWGTDEKTFFRILLKAPLKHLVAMDAVYARKYGYTLEKAIKKELGGKVEDAALMAIGMLLKPYETLAVLFESTMKGFGTDEKGLSYCMVRYQQLLPQIKEAYEKKYKKSLRDRIRGETSGKYRQLLFEMLRE